MELENARLENLVSCQQKEIEKQNNMINELARLHNDCMEYDRQKTEFFSNIIHELKMPLSVILGAIQLIEQRNCSNADEKCSYAKHIQTIKRNCYRLLRLVGNMLDIAKVDSGYAVLNLSNQNIVSLVEEITQSVAPYAYQKNLRLEFDTSDEEIITAVDVDKIERIILNLLSNAIKFSKAGGTVWVNLKKGNGKVFISVKDTGPGIPPDKQKKIFERFRQVNSPLTRAAEGTGIGLSLVKSFVELHNGVIRVESTEGKGSEFIVELPLRLASPEAEAATAKYAVHDRIIESIRVELSDIHVSGSLS